MYHLYDDNSQINLCSRDLSLELQTHPSTYLLDLLNFRYPIGFSNSTHSKMESSTNHHSTPILHFSLCSLSWFNSDIAFHMLYQAGNLGTSFPSPTHLNQSFKFYGFHLFSKMTSLLSVPVTPLLEHVLEYFKSFIICLSNSTLLHKSVFMLLTDLSRPFLNC